MTLSERSEQTRSTSEGGSGISDTGRGHVCPCGRSHPSKGRRRWRDFIDSGTGEVTRQVIPAGREDRYQDHGVLTKSLYEAMASGKAERSEEGFWEVRYSGNCTEPIPIRRSAKTGWLEVTMLTRCRKCKNCLRAKQFYWARTAMRWTEQTDGQGLRTWFGTLTLTQDSQQWFLEQARSKWCDISATSSEISEWWDDVRCDERFRLVREELVKEVQRYWKRLRKGVKRCTRCYPRKPRKPDEWDHPPATFKYFLVFERHKSGLPHMHWLLHEAESQILLKQLECAWPHGFTKVKLVKGDDVRKAAYYVSKYLGKAVQARQIASINYAKIKSSSEQVQDHEKGLLRKPQ